MASLREIAREYKDEIMSGIAWVAIWKTGRSWNARVFWLNSDAEKIECEEMEEARAIVAADENAIFINEYYTAHMGEGKLDEIMDGIRYMYEEGYRISRTHVTIRRRVFKRTRRQLLRGYRELRRDGTLRKERAQKLVSYNSYIEQSDSFSLREKYHTDELLSVAYQVNGFYGRLEHQKRKEELNDLLKRRRGSEAAERRIGRTSRRKKDRQDD